MTKLNLIKIIVMKPFTIFYKIDSIMYGILDIDIEFDSLINN